MLKWLLLLLFPFPVAAQAVLHDPAFDSIEKHLPKNWALTRSGNEITISSNDSIWLCRVNAYDYLNESDSVLLNGQPTRHVKSLSGGKKSRAYIRLLIDTFYNETQLLELKMHNEVLQRDLQKATDSSWLPLRVLNARPEVFLNLTQQETGECERVEAARKKLYTGLKKIPDYITASSSLHVVSFNGNGKYSGFRGEIVPHSVSLEWNYVTLTLLPRFSKTISCPF